MSAILHQLIRVSCPAQIITDRSEVARVYRSYWKVQPLRMAIVAGDIRCVFVVETQTLPACYDSCRNGELDGEPVSVGKAVEERA
jgi:hypothetical protein